MHADSSAVQELPSDETVRAELVACGRKLLGRGLLSQTEGNLSVRAGGGAIYITPSSIAYDEIEASDIVVVNSGGAVEHGTRSASSETPLHCLVYRQRPDVKAIVHTHSPFATTLSILGLAIPAVHYMIAALHATEVSVAKYATYGTSELARNVLEAFATPRRAVLIANHGVLAVGETLLEAAACAETTEALAGLYYRSLALGEPNVLSEEQMSMVMAKYRAKGTPEASEGPPTGA